MILSTSRFIGRANLRKRLEPLEGIAGRSLYVDGVVRLELVDEVLSIRPPFGLGHEREYAFVHVEPLLAALAEDRLVGAILVRLGGYAIGVFDGEALVASKVGQRYVHGRHRAGGSSANRFRRRRDEQARTLREEAAETAAQVLGPYVERLDAVALGGDRTAIRETLAVRPELAAVESKALERFFTVPEPRLRVLEQLPYELYSAEVASERR